MHALQVEISNVQIEEEKARTTKKINELSRKLHMIHISDDPARLKKSLEKERVGCVFFGIPHLQPFLSVRRLTGMLLLQKKMVDLGLQQLSVKEQMQTYRKDLTFVNSLRKEFH